MIKARHQAGGENGGDARGHAAPPLGAPRLGAPRLGALDGLRGVPACGVAFLYHPLLKADALMSGDPPLPLRWLREWGWTFVDLFFVISGYIFAHVYLARGGLRREDMTGFAVARVARLYPLHLLMLLVSAAMFAGADDNTALAFLGHLFMLQGFVGEVSHTFNAPSWSISVEIVCYIVFVLAAVRGDRILRWVTAGAIALALAHFVLRGLPGGPRMFDSLPRGVLGFFVGQALWRWRAALAKVPAALLVLGLAGGLAIDMGQGSSIPPITLLAWPCALCLALRMPAVASAPMLWLGDRSYAIYLIHFPVLLVFLPSIQGAAGGAQAAALVLAYTALVLLLSDLAYRRFELPARRAIRAGWERRGSMDAGLA